MIKFAPQRSASSRMAVFGSPSSVFVAVSVSGSISPNLARARVMFAIACSSKILSHSLKKSEGIGIAHGAIGAGISATDTIFTILPSGQIIRAASSTAARLYSEPSTASIIFIAFLIDIHVEYVFNDLLLHSGYIPRQSLCRAKNDAY